MTGERDAFDLLKLANPVPARASDDATMAATLDEVLDRIVASPPVERRSLWRPVRRRRRLRIAVVGVMALGTVGWTVFALRDEPTKPLTIGCYEAADLDARVEVAAADGRPPEEVCRELWRRGAFGNVPVPDLAACVLATGTVGVFPGTGAGTCADVQSAPLPPDTTAPGTPDVVALREALVETYLAEGCIAAGPAREIVARHLAERGFTGWTVVVGDGFGPERPCATLAFDVESSRVLVVPVPRMP